MANITDDSFDQQSLGTMLRIRRKNPNAFKNSIQRVLYKRHCWDNFQYFLNHINNISEFNHDSGLRKICVSQKQDVVFLSNVVVC